MTKHLTIVALFFILLFLAVDSFAYLNYPYSTYGGFWQGIWHGIISFITLPFSVWFPGSIHVYNPNNNGLGYNFGFVILALCVCGLSIPLLIFAWILRGLFWGILILIAILIAVATKGISSIIIKILIFLTLLLPPLLNIHADHIRIRFFKNPAHLLKIGKNKIYTSQPPKWFHTVISATNFIKKNVPPLDKILVLPLDPLYLFLSDRDSAARQLVFFEHINITEKQEQKTISEMEDGNGNWVIISNRAVSQEQGLGVFGKTYCPLLAKYIGDHFTVVAEFGDWVNPPGWAWNHGVRILKRVP